MGVPKDMNDKITSIYMNAPCIEVWQHNHCAGYARNIINDDKFQGCRRNLKHKYCDFNDRISSLRVCVNVYKNTSP